MVSDMKSRSKLRHGIFAGDLFLGLVVALFAVLFMSADVFGQTGAVTAQTASQKIVKANLGAAPEHITQIASQPQLERHLSRINQFRTLFHTGNDQTPAGPNHRTARFSPHTESSLVIPRGTVDAGPNAQDLAILELTESISSRKGPSMYYPGVGVVIALQAISTLSEKTMIDALGKGGVPIYSAMGHVVGVEDPQTGQLLGGRRG
jgi:hypothetical protein